ncbi:MAG: DUF6854 domain-containing protein [Paracoccaceae bacterium]
MITVAACDSDFMPEAVPLAVKLAAELVDKAGAMGARAGTLVTGPNPGSLFLGQTYSDIGGIERAFDQYAASATYKTLIGSGKLSVSVRAIMKLEDASIEPTPGEVPAYMVLTRWLSADPMTERAASILPVFQANGAMMVRYGTVIAGPTAGVRVLGVAYPSMDAIEQTYGALMGNADYQSFVSEVDIVSRNIVRIAGKNETSLPRSFDFPRRLLKHMLRLWTRSGDRLGKAVAEHG